MSFIAPGRETRCEKIDFGKNGILSEMQSSSIDPRISGWLKLLLKLRLSGVTDNSFMARVQSRRETCLFVAEIGKSSPSHPKAGNAF